jgi:SP family general alpha glucoside:H+ symporter-like MFS transporter
MLLTFLGPWWLCRKGKFEQARKSLKGIVSRKVDIEPLLANIAKTVQLEQEMETGSAYKDLFKTVNLRRTEICTGVYTVQVFTGIYLIGYGVYFFERMFFNEPDPATRYKLTRA